MALGIVSSEDFEAELIKTSYPQKESLPSIITPVEKGRGEGTKEIPAIIREIISSDAIENGSRATLGNLAKFLDVSASSVSAWKNNATSTATYDKQNEPLRKSNNRTKKVITLKATRVMKAALNNITEDKLADSKATELSQIARNMSGIIMDMEPVEKREVSEAAKIIIYKPAMQFNENNYDTIHLNE